MGIILLVIVFIGLIVYLVVKYRNPNISLGLLLVGRGSQEIKLKKLVEDLGLKNETIFTGYVNHEDIVKYFNTTDICVFPSRFEPFGNVVVQAWAQKTSLICSKSQGPLQYVRDGQDALMFDIDDVEQLSQKIKQLIDDKDLSARLVNAGYERYKSEFSKEKIVADYIAFYQKIIKENFCS